ncbi:MAG: methionine synthase [Nocardioides sp.]|uniref:methionine synthase n=1 Tax=Nocardioides sp. TaxID=35761 RepID=UPI0039E6D0B5
MTRATGIGSLPGTDLGAAVRLVFDETAAEGFVPYLPELPARGPGADMIGRTLAIVGELDADLQPAGWRLTGSSGSPGLDQRRARSLLGQDLDVVEEESQGYAGPLKLQLAGPLTLAASVERPRGDKLLADHGARRELAQALAEGVAGHVRDVRRRVPGADRLIVQFDEPALAAVAAGRVPTASGYGRHRSVQPPEIDELLRTVFATATAPDEDGRDGQDERDEQRRRSEEAWLHSCAAGTPLGLARTAGAAGLAVDLAVLGAGDHDALAELMESGGSVGLGVVPSLEPPSWPTTGRLAERVQRWLDMVGLDPDLAGDRLVITPACGLAGASPQWARRAVALAAEVAAALS